MSSPEDNRLRALFATLREQDRSAAPPFGEPAAAAAAGSSRRRSSLRIALAALTVLVVAMMFTLRVRRSTGAVPRELAAWSSPTAFLLETPGREFLNRTPRLGGQLIHVLPATQDGPK